MQATPGKPTPRQMMGDGSIASRVILEYIEDHAGDDAPEDLVARFEEDTHRVILEGTPRDDRARLHLVEIVYDIEGIVKVEDRMARTRRGQRA